MRVIRYALPLASSLSLFSANPGAHAAVSPILKGPYLQQCSDSEVSIRVELGSKGSATAELSSPSLSSPKSVTSEDKDFHELRFTGLSPSTAYTYSVRAEGATVSGKFTTAPKPDGKGTFTFLAYGDNRSDHVAHERVVRAMMAVPSDFLAHTGDFVSIGSRSGDWQKFFDIEGPLLRNQCLFSAVGNHELSADQTAANYIRYFGPRGAGPLYGTFRWQNARFFMLNAFHKWDQGDERDWLDKELAKAEGEAGLDWRFVLIHHGPYSAGPHHGNQRLVDAKIPELLVSRGVNLLFAGHDHIYERGEVSGLKYVVTGGGGAPLYEVAKRHPGTRKAEAAHHFVEVRVSADKVDLVARRADGSTLEACSFAKTGGFLCDAAAAATDAGASSDKPSPSSSDPVRPRSCACEAAADRSSGRSATALFLASILGLSMRRRTAAGKAARSS